MSGQPDVPALLPDLIREVRYTSLLYPPMRSAAPQQRSLVAAVREMLLVEKELDTQRYHARHAALKEAMRTGVTLPWNGHVAYTSRRTHFLEWLDRQVPQFGPGYPLLWLIRETMEWHQLPDEEQAKDLIVLARDGLTAPWENGRPIVPSIARWLRATPSKT